MAIRNNNYLICIATKHSKFKKLHNQLYNMHVVYVKIFFKVIYQSLCVLFVYVYMCKNQCIRLTLSILFASTFSHNIDTCYLNGAQVATESSRLKH